MDIFNNLKQNARNKVRTIVLPEGEDERIIQAAIKLDKKQLAKVILLGDEKILHKNLDDFGARNNKITVIDPATSPRRDVYQNELYEVRKAKGITKKQAQELITQPLVFANLMLRTGDADACVAGAVHATADVVRNALQLIGSADRVKLVSSFFIMVLKEKVAGLDSLIFADCALNIEPDANELSKIARASVESARQLLGIKPKVAFLSFSTNGSARHSKVNKIKEATKLAKKIMPKVDIIGEVQLDAAIDNEILTVKYPASGFEAPANVLIFPNLEAANIGYKLTQRFANAKAVGPILQGLAKPVNDLSRGCSVDDIVATVVVSANQV